MAGRGGRVQASNESSRAFPRAMVRDFQHDGPELLLRRLGELLWAHCEAALAGAMVELAP